MSDLAARVFLILLPVVLCAAALRLPLYRGSRVSAFLEREQHERRTMAPLYLLLCLIPLALALTANGSSAFKLLASGLSILGCLWGATRLAGRTGVAVAAALFLSFFVWNGAALASYDALAVLAAIGGASLLAVIARDGATVTRFLGLLAAVDVLVVGAGLTAAALFPARFSHDFPYAATPPVFAGVAVHGVFLGGIDLSAALLCAIPLQPLSTRAQMALLAVFGLSQAATVAGGDLLGHAVPATVPAFLTALLATKAVKGRTTPGPDPTIAAAKR